MTGFGTGHAAHGGEEIHVEVRSVNHKFCEVKVRLPREFGAFELEISRQVKDRLARGGVDVTVRRSGGRSSVVPRVDVALASEYARAFQEIRDRLGLPGAVALADVLAAEGVVVLEERAIAVDSVRLAVNEALGQALAELSAMRAREGQALSRDIEGRLEQVSALADRVEGFVPAAVEHYRTRLQDRMHELVSGHAVDQGRLAQEVALFADRMDVAEEITRLGSHVEQMRALTRSDEPAGRKMEFLVQEMHREANTIGSKSQSADISALVVAMKAEIERVREQVQNVE